MSPQQLKFKEGEQWQNHLAQQTLLMSFISWQLEFARPAAKEGEFCLWWESWLAEWFISSTSWWPQVSPQFPYEALQSTPSGTCKGKSPSGQLDGSKDEVPSWWAGHSWSEDYFDQRRPVPRAFSCCKSFGKKGGSAPKRGGYCRSPVYYLGALRCSWNKSPSLGVMQRSRQEEYFPYHST